VEFSPELIAVIQKAERIAKVQWCGRGYLDEGHSVYAWYHEDDPEDIVWTRGTDGLAEALNGLHLEDLAQTLYDFHHISWREKELIMVEYAGRAPFGGNTMKQPSDFKDHPYSSTKQNHEAEVVARNIMVILARTGDEWRELSWAEYKAARLEDGNFTGAEGSLFNQVIGFCKSVDTAVLFSPKWKDAANQ